MKLLKKIYVLKSKKKYPILCYLILIYVITKQNVLCLKAINLLLITAKHN